MEDFAQFEKTKKNKKSADFWSELLKTILIAAIIVIPFRLYIAQPFIVDGASMDPTFKTGQYLIVDELTYRFKEPERGSVIIFKYPKDPKKYFIKRIIGLPGETVVLRNGLVTIRKENGDEENISEPYIKLAKADNMEFSLRENEYFVMGDNRLGSADSRIWGALPKENIIGRPIIQFVPPVLFPGDFENMIPLLPTR